MALLPAIRRPRLIDELSDTTVRVVKLIAPAGYGKTTLLMSALQEQVPHAIVDLERVTTTIDVFRRTVMATAAVQSDAVRSDLPDQLLGLGEDERGWEALAAGFLASAPAKFLLCFDNGETIGDDRDLQSAIERIVTQLPSDARIIVGSRQNILRFGRFAGPDRTRILSARDLRFNTREIYELFRSLSLSRSDIEAIERFTQGWPIVVMMLFALARRGRLHAYLGEQDDVSDLYGYLASEVFATLPEQLAGILEALTAVPNATADELALLFPETDITQSLQSLQSETPFVATAGPILTIHPAMREMISTNIDIDVYRARLYELVSRSDRGVRAAEIAMLRNRPLDAARVLAENRSLGDFWTPSHAGVFSALPEHVYLEYPVLWSAAHYFRATHDAEATIQTGRWLLAHSAESTPADVRIDIMSSVIQLLADRGRLREAQDLADTFVTHPALAGNRRASTLKAFFSAIIAFQRGDPVDVPRFQADFATLFLTSPVQQCFRDVSVLAPHYRARGAEALERAAIEQGIETSRGTRIPFVMCTSAAYGAISAWFWGHSALFERYLAELESALTPSLNNGFGHFLACARGRGLTAVPSSEKMDMRMYAYAIGVTLSRDPATRQTLAELALVAAQQSSQRFCEVLARVILSFVDRQRSAEHLLRAERLALEMESPALISAVNALRSGSTAESMFASLIARLSPHGSGSEVAVKIHEGNGDVSVGSNPIALSRRERELLVYLATHSAATDGRTIAKAIWAGSSEERALLSLRVTVNRVRKRIGRPNVIVATENGYSLGVPVQFQSEGSAVASTR